MEVTWTIGEMVGDGSVGVMNEKWRPQKMRGERASERVFDLERPSFFAAGTIHIRSFLQLGHSIHPYLFITSPSLSPCLCSSVAGRHYSKSNDGNDSTLPLPRLRPRLRLKRSSAFYPPAYLQRI